MWSTVNKNVTFVSLCGTVSHAKVSCELLHVKEGRRKEERKREREGRENTRDVEVERKMVRKSKGDI